MAGKGGIETCKHGGADWGGMVAGKGASRLVNMGGLTGVVWWQARGHPDL